MFSERNWDILKADCAIKNISERKITVKKSSGGVIVIKIKIRVIITDILVGFKKFMMQCPMCECYLKLSKNYPKQTAALKPR